MDIILGEFLIFNDGCIDKSCQCHAPQIKPQEQEEWEIEFDKAVAQNYKGQDPYWPDWEGVKSFIRSLLQTQKAEIIDKIKNNEICTNCGADKYSELSNWCNNCLENE